MRLLLPSLFLLAACQSTSTGVATADARRIEAEVSAALTAIPVDLARGGPLAWLRHFDDAPDFYMASEGETKFASFAEARAAMEDFGPTIETMQLVWSDLRVDVLGAELAGFGAGYDELLVTAAGDELRFAGYVTGVMRRTPAGWRIAQLHWSMKAP